MTLAPRLPSHARPTIERFIAAHVRQADASGVVLGMSGGIDSAVTARLASNAIGPQRVTGLLMPDSMHPEALLKETQQDIAHLGATGVVHEIDAIETAYRTHWPGLTDRVTLGNLKARIRMSLLYTEARERRALVVGTGNKSELLVGYFTKYGDGGVDIVPLGDLYKTQVRELARGLDVPKTIQDRPPTAGLWEGQTDEDELGITYDDLDVILYGLEQLKTEAEIVAESGISSEKVAQVARRVEATRHKRRPAPIPKIALRTIGLDWRE